jgi:hypothetical protein
VLLRLTTDSRFGDTRWKKLRRVGSLGRDQPLHSSGDTPEGTVARHNEATTASPWEEGAFNAHPRREERTPWRAQSQEGIEPPRA